MLARLKKKVVYFFRTWRVKDSDSVEIEIPYSLEGDAESIAISGKLYKVLTDVELEIHFVKQWPVEILILYYAAVLDMYFEDELTENNIRMFLHPEAYEELELRLQGDEENLDNNIL